VNPANDTDPDGVVTITFPLAPPDPTTAVICVALLTVKEAADVPPNDTSVAPVKFVPVITILEPLYPEVDVKEEIVGGVEVKPASFPIAMYEPAGMEAGN